MRQLWRVLKDERPQLRFWGKIFGRKANYYIIEAEVVGDEPSPQIPGPWDDWQPPKPPLMILESYEIAGKFVLITFLWGDNNTQINV